MQYEVTDSVIEGHKVQNLKIRFKVTDNVGIQRALIRLAKGGDSDSFADRDGTYDEKNQIVSVDCIITEFYPTADYYVESISLNDFAGNETCIEFSDSPIHEKRKSIHIVTENPDTEAPIIDLNRISVYAEPTHPEAPDGETKVTINYYAKDDKAGYDIGHYDLLDPQGISHGNWHYISGGGAMFYDGDPTVWKRYTINCILPQGSTPGIWGLASLKLWDKALNVRTYNFVETLIFEPDDNLDDYILLSDIKDNELTLKMTKTEGNGYSYGYRIINEDTGEEISGEMNAQTTNKARRTRSSDSSVMDADYAAIIDVSELSDGNCIAIVQVKNEEGKAVAVRNTRFVKGTSTSISNIVEGKYDKLTPIYDLQGRKITVPAKGVYIQNGRKFVVK